MIRTGQIIFLLLVLTCAAVLPGSASETYSKYQLATIAKVERHAPTSTTPNDYIVRYNVELNVGDTTYIILLTPDNNSNSLEYRAGQNLMVSIGQKTMRFKDLLGRTRQAVILSSEKTSHKKKVD